MSSLHGTQLDLSVLRGGVLKRTQGIGLVKLIRYTLHGKTFRWMACSWLLERTTSCIPIFHPHISSIWSRLCTSVEADFDSSRSYVCMLLSDSQKLKIETSSISASMASSPIVNPAIGSSTETFCGSDDSDVASSGMVD